jgi:Holliday junction resolvase RusA-like endonuclease
MVFLLKRPKSHYRVNGALKPWAVDARPTGKPDADKLARSTLDALTGIIFTDDALVVRLVAEKFYAEPGHEGAVITIDGPGIRICEAPLSRAGP